MFLATAIVSVVLAALLAFSALRKLSGKEQVVDTYLRVGVPEDKLKYLAIVLLAGAAGLVPGVFWPPIGIAAAIGLVCYFTVAAAFHIRANDTKNLAAPLMLALMAAVVLVLHLAERSRTA